MRGAIASTIYDCKGLAARFWHGQSTRAERSYGRVHEQWARYSGPVQRSIWCILMGKRCARSRRCRMLWARF